MSALTERLRELSMYLEADDTWNPSAAGIPSDAADTIDELAEALRAFVTAFDNDRFYFGDECERARAALAKAGL